MTALDSEGREAERPTTATQRLERLLDQARKHLIDIGTRNRLIHTNRKAKRPATLHLSHSDPDVLFRRLAVEGVSFRFLPDAAATERERWQSAESDSDENLRGACRRGRCCSSRTERRRCSRNSSRRRGASKEAHALRTRFQDPRGRARRQHTVPRDRVSALVRRGRLGGRT